MRTCVKGPYDGFTNLKPNLHFKCRACLLPRWPIATKTVRISRGCSGFLRRGGLLDKQELEIGNDRIARDPYSSVYANALYKTLRYLLSTIVRRRVQARPAAHRRSPDPIMTEGFSRCFPCEWQLFTAGKFGRLKHYVKTPASMMPPITLSLTPRHSGPVDEISASFEKSSYNMVPIEPRRNQLPDA